MLIPRRPIKRRRDGRFEINLGDEERQLLRSQLDQLRDLLMGQGPLVKRLFPTAYPDDPERDEQYQQLMRGPLLESHFSAVEAMEATLDATVVGEGDLTQWMHTINALRLVVGTGLEISEDDSERIPDEEDPNYQLHVLYHVLTWLLHWVVTSLTAALPPPLDDDPPASPAEVAPSAADLEALDGFTDLQDLEGLGGFGVDDHEPDDPTAG